MIQRCSYSDVILAYHTALPQGRISRTPDLGDREVISAAHVNPL